MSADGRARLARLHAALAPAIAGRGRASLASRVRAAWLALGGPACIDDPLDLDGAERYFALLARHEHGGDLPDWPAFAAVAGKLFAQRQDDAAPAVQVMTLHKAKGLEFDTVILPGLARDTRHGDDPPLRWALRAEEGGARTLLLAPLRARVGVRSLPDPVYAYLEVARRRRGHGRVRPPAVRGMHAREARAASRRGTRHQGRDGPNGALLGAAARAFGARAPVARSRGSRRAAGTAPGSRGQRRRGGAGRAAARAPAARVAAACAAAADRDGRCSGRRRRRHAAVRLGTGDRGRDRHRHAPAARAGRAGRDRDVDTRTRVAAQRARALAELAGEGVAPDARAGAADVVQTALARTLADPKGQWLFASTHDDARSEWALAGAHGDAIEHVTLDRTFVADGVRWIVDYKTGSHAGGDASGFLDRERERYRAQLERYAAFVRALDARPIRVALYFPLVPDGWREWAYDG